MRRGMRLLRRMGGRGEKRSVKENERVQKDIISKGTIDEEYIQEVKDKYAQIIKPIDDQRSKAIYRKGICLNLLGYYLEDLM